MREHRGTRKPYNMRCIRSSRWDALIGGYMREARDLVSCEHASKSLMQCDSNATHDIEAAVPIAEGLNCAADFATVHEVAERIAGAHVIISAPIKQS
jgi:hypothetical protein